MARKTSLNILLIVSLLKGPSLASCSASQHLGFALRVIESRAHFLLQFFADFQRDCGALVEQLQDLQVDWVNLIPQLLQTTWC